MALLVLSAGDQIGLSLGNFDVVGTRSGSETVVLNDPGNGSLTVTLDPSFNQGGDTIVLAGSASDYTIVRSGSSAVLTNGSITVTIPVGLAGAEVVFANGPGGADDDSRTLFFDPQQNAIVLGDQVVGFTPADVEGDDAPLTVSVSDTSVTEGDAGSKLATFTLELSDVPSEAVTVSYSTSPGTATPNDDYVPVAGTVTFAAGQTTATVSVQILGDTDVENDETFILTANLNGAASGTGTIVNDDVIQGTFTAGQDTLVGTPEGDLFVAQNNNLNAGDSVDGRGGFDSVELATDNAVDTRDNDPSLFGVNLVAEFGGFTFNGVERFAVTNDSNVENIFDLSGTSGLQVLETVNSSSSTTFNQVARETQTLNIFNATNDTNDVDVFVSYRNSAVTGENTLDINIDESLVNRIRVGSSSDDDAGIEQINLNVSGDTVIEDLDSAITRLFINGDGNIEIEDLENQTNLMQINASGSTGTVELSFADTDNDVDYDGSSGADIIEAGDGDDDIDTGDGDDVVDGGNGNDDINTGNGADTVTSSGGSDSIDTGADMDTITVENGTGITNIDAGSEDDEIEFEAGAFGNGTIGGADFVDGGTGDDNLTINETVNDADFNRTTRVEELTLGTGGTTVNLGIFAETAGIRTINLSTGSDSVFLDRDNAGADDFNAGVTVNSNPGGGNDTVVTSDGDDTFNFDNNLTGADNLDAGNGSDTLNLDGDTAVNNNGFTAFETVNLAGTEDADYDLDLGNNNAPTANGTLTINGGGLGIDDQVDLDTSDVTNFGLNVTTGAAADDFLLGNVSHVIMSNGGADRVASNGTLNSSINVDLGEGNNIFGAGPEGLTAISNNDLGAFSNNGSTTVTSGAGNDSIDVEGNGTNTINSGGGVDFISADGTSMIDAGEGDDVITIDSIDANDTVNGNSGNDTLAGNGTVVDSQFTGVTNVENLSATNPELFTTSGTPLNATLGALAQAAGIRNVNLGEDDDTLNAGAFTADLTVDMDGFVLATPIGNVSYMGGGNDTVTTGSGNDRVILDGGDDDLTLNGGDDVVEVQGMELDGDDAIAGGLGDDTVELDNAGGAVNARVDLAQVTSIENYVLTDDGDRTVGVDADANSLSFTGAGDLVGTLTEIDIDASMLTDADDSFDVLLEAGLGDADFEFNIFGAGSGVDVTVRKDNINVNNNVNFFGSDSNDTLEIDGRDLGSTISFTGGAGVDTLVQTGGEFDDDGFDNISGIEVLMAEDGGRLRATLGQQAEESGFNTIVGGDGRDIIDIDQAFDGTITVDLSQGGRDDFFGEDSDAVFNFVLGQELQANDTIRGGSTANDTLAVVGEDGNTDATGVSGVETITMSSGSPLSAETSRLVLDTQVGEIASPTQTIDVDMDSLDDLIIDVINSGPNDVSYDIFLDGVDLATVTTGTGNDFIGGGEGVDIEARTNDGNDTVTVGLNGRGEIYGGDGDDTLFGNNLNDILVGGNGEDTINGGAGDDDLFGGNGIDTITAGAGEDEIVGGAEGDFIILSDDNVTDVIYYSDASESTTAIEGRFDVITGFESGVDQIDLSAIGGGRPIVFLGNVNNFAAVDSSLSDGTNGDQIEAIYDQVANILYIDIDDDGDIDSDDLQIVIETEGDTGLQAQDVGAPGSTNAGAGTSAEPVVNNAGVAGPMGDEFTEDELNFGDPVAMMMLASEMQVY